MNRVVRVADVYLGFARHALSDAWASRGEARLGALIDALRWAYLAWDAGDAILRYEDDDQLESTDWGIDGVPRA